MTLLVEGLKEARQALQSRDWRKAQAILRHVFPHSTNSKFIAELLRAGMLAQRDGELEQAEHLYWLAIEIYESGRDENGEVVTAIRMLSEMLTKVGRHDDHRALCERTFPLVLTTAEGLNRVIKSLNRQLSEHEQKSTFH